MDYAGLIEVITAQSNNTAVANRASKFTKDAEAYLSRKLRTAEMETSIELTTDSDGYSDLPEDFLTFSYVSVGKRVLPYLDNQLLLNRLNVGYTIQNNKLLSYYADQAHDCLYYASLPNIASNQTNWLLDTNPELYKYAVLHQVYLFNNDVENAMRARSMSEDLILQINAEDMTKRYNGKTVNLSGVGV